MRDIVTVKQLDTIEISQQSSVLSSTVINSFFSYLDVSKVTLTAYKVGIKQFMLFTQQNGVKALTRNTVIMFKKELISSGRKSSTVALYLSALRRFFDWCEAEGIYQNVARGVKSPKQERTHKRDALSGSQIRECLQGFKRTTEQGARDYAVFLLMSTCGLRCCEVVRADIGDIQQVQGVPVLFVRGKGRREKDSFVKLTQPVIDALQSYLGMRGQVNENEPLFASCSKRNRGGRLTTRTISSIAKTSMRQAGYNSLRLSAHSLRHSAATLAISAGMPLQEVSEFLRHSDISITMVYVHSLARLKSQCENAVTSAIFAA